MSACGQTELDLRFERLRALSADEARSILAREAAQLDAAIAACEEGRSPHPTRSALSAAAELGAPLRSLLALAAGQSGGRAIDRLDFIEDDLDWIESSARLLEQLHQPLAGSSHELLAAVHDARTRLTALRQERLLRSAPTPGDTSRSPEALWGQVLECSDVEARIRSACGEHTDADAAPDAAALESHRRGLSEALRARLAGCDRESRARFAVEASAQLLDRSRAAMAEAAPAAGPAGLASLRLLRQEIGHFLGLLDAMVGDFTGSNAGDPAAAAMRSSLQERKRALQAARRRARALEREVETHQAMERSRYGRIAARSEAPLVFLLFLFIGVVVLEWRLPPDSPWLRYVHAADIGLCLVLQAEFVLRWASVRWSGAYFWRHFFLESLPAFPYGFLLHHVESLPSWAGVEELRAVIIVRLLSLRGVLVVLARAARIIAFFVRGTDRVVERMRPVLDREILLFDDQREPAPEAHGIESKIAALESRRRRCVRRLLEQAPLGERSDALASILSGLTAEAEQAGASGLPYRSCPRSEQGDLHLERIVHGLLDCDASRAIAACGRDGVARIARWLRYFDVPVIRHGPLVRGIIPAARLPEPPEAVAAAAHAMGRVLQRVLGALRFWGDLSGITTGPQILDRVGTAIVAATSRPAVRLLLLAGVILAIKGFAWLVPALDRTATGLWRGLGTPVLVLGIACLVLMLLGRWLRRIAGQALDLYLRTADAHHYALLKTWKIGRRRADIEMLAWSVLGPEAGLQRRPFAALAAELDAECSALPLRPGCEPGTLEPRHDSGAALVANLYREFLDGPLLHRSDDKTSVQILGNLAVQEVRFQVLGATRRQVRALEKLDLEKQRLLGLGPYFWFRFITESLAIETAKLVMEYNSTCIALDDLPLAAPEKRRRFDAFLQARRLPWDVAVERSASRGLQLVGEAMTTGDFTALHFLAADPRLEQSVLARYGEAVLAAVRRDRVGMVRDVFGTRPYHLLPRSRRAVNPYRVYRRYLRGALFLLLPLVVLLAAARAIAGAVRDVLRLTLDLLGRSAPVVGQPSRRAPFHVAVRKINRMRKPFFMEAMRLRASVDIEYLGLGVPGHDREEGAPHFRGDLDYVGALESERQPLELMREKALGDLAELNQYLERRGWLAGGAEGLLPGLGLDDLAGRRGEAVRAVTTAFITDHHGLRAAVTAPAAARALVEEALRRRRGPGGRLVLGVKAIAGASLWPSWRRRRRALSTYLAEDKSWRALTRAEQSRLRLEIVEAPRGAEKTLELAARVIASEGGPGDMVESEMRAAARNHSGWTRRILTLRAVQALTVLDIQCYRDLVRRAGEFGEEEGAGAC